MSRKLTIIVALLGAVALLAWVTISRPHRAARPAPPVDPPWEFALRGVRLDLDPDSMGGRPVAERIAERAISTGPTLPAVDGLSQVISDRVEFLVNPPESLDAWRDEVRRFGKPPAGLEAESPSTEAQGYWADSVAALKGARMSSERVRIVAPATTERRGVPGTMFVRPNPFAAGSTYPPPAAGAQTAELQFSAEFRINDGTHVPATVAMLFWYNGSEWAPYDMIVYFQMSHVDGKSMPFPAF